jgi:outer membrane protein TolC
VRKTKSLFFLILLAQPASAETLRLSVNDAIQMALSKGTEAQLARSARERANVSVTEALGGLLPQADARFMQTNQSINLATFGFTLPGFPPVIGPFNVTDAQVTAAMQLFNLAAIRHYAAVKQEVAASSYDLAQAENDVAAAVARLYVLLQRADAQVAARDADVKLFEQLLRVANDQFNAGTATRLDVDQARIQLARVQQALLSARNDRENARVALLNAIGADQSSDVVVSDPLPDRVDVPPLENALSTAQQRPELRAIDTRIKEARLGLEAARARRLPSVGLDFAGDYAGNTTNDMHWTRRITGALSMPVFQTQINANIARASIQLHDAEIQRDALRRNVEADVRRAVLNLDNTNARLKLAAENATVSEEALTVARDRQAAGYGSTVEVDRAQDAYRQAHEDLIAARAEAAAAEYDYRRAVGAMLSSGGQPPSPVGTGEAPVLHGNLP